MSLRRLSTGFTLIELMIVLLIAGLLAALTVTAVSGYVRRASNLKVIADVKAIVRLVPLQAKKKLCASYLSVDVKSQRLEAWVCGVMQRQVTVDAPYSIKMIDHALKSDAEVENISVVWYTPRTGGASARLDIFDGDIQIQSIDLSMVTSYFAAK